jgi:fructan beta-fructosidase
MIEKLTTVLFTLLIFFACQNTDDSSLSDVSAEAHRPHFHFTPPAKWMNDPNGMVYYEGEYHLFYQHYPDSTVWGPMHWGHAISTDLVHWEHLPIALYPDSLGYIFSGSAVVDWKNTSGLGEKGAPPLIVIFTHHDPVGEKGGKNDFQYQSIAYSNDKGRTWTKYEGNPVVPNPGIRDFRDPKVIWDEGSEQWVMVFAAGDHVKFYRSPNLKDWEYLSDFGREWGSHAGVWECPDLFPMKIEGTDEVKWVLLLSINPGGPNGGSATQYFVGHFDGQSFVLDEEFAERVKPISPESEKAVWLDWGRDNYAGVTWSDAPDNRRLFMGWMSNWDYAQVVPTEAWRSAMTLPRELRLKRTEGQFQLETKPVKELQALRGKQFTIEPKKLSGELNLTEQLDFSPATSEMILELELHDYTAVDVSIVLSNTQGESYRIGLDAAHSRFYSDRTKAGDASFSTAFAYQ